MKYRINPVTAYEQNSTLLWCEKTRQAAVTDPGGDLDVILHTCRQEQVELTKILLTHGHIDHVGYTRALREETGVPVIGPHRDDRFLLQEIDEYGQRLGLGHSGSFEPDQWLQDGDQIEIGEVMLQVIHCPGHTPGHVVFYQPEDQVAIVGDVLFRGSIGRTDFPRSVHADLIQSIKQKLLPLGESVAFIPGHGPNSTFGEEKRSNPFIQ